MGAGWVLGFAVTVGVIPVVVAYGWNRRDVPLDWSPHRKALRRLAAQERDAHNAMKERW